MAIIITGDSIQTPHLLVDSDDQFFGTNSQNRVIFNNVVTISGNLTANTIVANVVTRETSTSSLELTQLGPVTGVIRPLLRITQDASSGANTVTVSNIPAWANKVTMTWGGFVVSAACNTTIRFGTSSTNAISTGYDWGITTNSTGVNSTGAFTSTFIRGGSTVAASGSMFGQWQFIKVPDARTSNQTFIIGKGLSGGSAFWTMGTFDSPDVTESTPIDRIHLGITAGTFSTAGTVTVYIE